MAAPIPLRTSDVQALQQAYGQLQAGNAVVAAATIERLFASGQRHPEALHMLAFIRQSQQRPTDALKLLEEVLALAPGHAAYWNSYGNLLGDVGRADAAIAALEKAVKLDAAYAEAWINLGITAFRADRNELAAIALGRATTLKPDAAQAWSLLGMVEQKLQNPEAAVQCFSRAIEIDPGALAVRHNLGAALRMLDEPSAALEEIDRAIAGGLAAPETLSIRAHLLADTGRFDEAIAQYQTVLGRHPDHLDAHETLARLLPQLGRQDEALDCYRAALKLERRSPALWHSALAAAKDTGNAAQLLAWSEEAQAAVGAQPEFQLSRAIALRRLGDPDAAKIVLQSLADEAPSYAPVHAHLAHLLLAGHDPAGAERHALRATELMPFEQSAWSSLTIIWRLLDDPREHWLAGYDRLVMPIDIVPPPEYGDGQTFLHALAATLGEMHQLDSHPIEQSLRGGTQTRGHIFNGKNPALRALANAIRDQVEQRIAALPDDESHPFLARKPSRIRFSGSWSVMLRGEGFHVNHIHPEGWLSSAYYVSLPPEMGASQEGALTFGVPDAALNLDLAPRRIEIPQAGRLVLFPSYLWHGTIPFKSKAPRLTVAFDAVPEGF